MYVLLGLVIMILPIVKEIGDKRQTRKGAVNGRSPRRRKCHRIGIRVALFCFD
jgi:hypothetical protein